MGALAADANGTLWFESGDPSEGLLTKVVSTASVPIVRTGIASLGRADQTAASPSANLLAPSRNGALLLALPTVVVEHSDDFVGVAGARGREGHSPGRQSGDGGPLRSARFRNIAAIASDHAGNVYVADEIDSDGGEIAIRFLNRSETPVTFFAGTPNELLVQPGTIDTIAGRDGRPTATLRAEAPGLAVAGDRLYLAATEAGPGRRSTVKMMNLGSQELAMHGVKVAVSAMATVVTTAADFNGGRSPSAPAIGGIAADQDGNLLFAEPASHRVRRLNGPGAITMFAGTGAAGFNGNDRRATDARLDGPYDVELGAGGRIYISDAGNEQVRVVGEDGIIRTALGNGTTNRWVCSEQTPDDGAEDRAPGASRTGRPESIASVAGGNVYIANKELRQLHRLAPSGSVVRVAGALPCGDVGGCPAAGDGSDPKLATLGALSGLTPGPAGGIYVMEEARVRFLNPTAASVAVHDISVPAGAMRTVAGEPPPEGLRPSPPPVPMGLPEGPPPTTPDAQPAIAEAPGVAYSASASDAGGNLFLGATPPGFFLGGNGSVRIVDRRGIITTLVEETEFGPTGTADPERCCTFPTGMVTDRAGNLYVADAAGRRVWFLNRSKAPVLAHGVSVAAGGLQPVAGAGNAGSQDPGIPALEARLSAPMGLALDGKGNLYIADFLAHGVRRVDAGGTIVTVAGNGQPGFNGDGLKGPLSALNQPTDVNIDGCGNLLVADSGNDRVRRLNLVTSCLSTTRATTARSSHPLRYVVAGAVLAFAVAARMLFDRRREGHSFTKAGIDGA